MDKARKTHYVVYLDSCYDEVVEGLLFASNKAEEDFLGDALADWLEETKPAAIRSNILDELKGINARLSWIEEQVARR
jgi:hypothetical protein